MRKQSKWSMVLAAVLCGFASFALAEDVARALVVQNNAVVKLYTIDDQNVWTAGETIVTAGANLTTKRPMRAIYRDGVVYVLDMIADAAEYGYIRKYSLAGDYLGDVCKLDARLDDFIFSEDGRYIYVSSAFGNCAGKIYRYDMQTAESELFATPGGNTRQLTWGPDGRLYVADRTGKLWGIVIADKVEDRTVSKLTTANVGAASGLYYDEVKGLFYTSDTGGNVRSVTIEGSVSSLGAPTSGRQCIWGARINGAPHFFSLNAAGGVNAVGVRLKEDGTFSTDIEWGGTFCSAMEIPLVLPNANWKLDEAANAIACVGEGTDVEVRMSRLLQSGATGVKNGALWFNESSSGRFADSATLIPATDEFTLSLWAGLPAVDSFGAPRTLFSNAAGAVGDLTLAVGAAEAPNALVLSFVTEGGTVSSVAEMPFADGKWHHLALSRKGADLKAYVDGALAVSLTVAADAAVAQTADWRLGATALGSDPAGAGACVDEVAFYSQALPAAAITSLAAEFDPDDLPAEGPDLPVASDLPATLGAQVAHSLAIDAPMSDSMLFKAGDGSLYLAFGRGDGFRDPDRSTVFRRSTDGGATWTENAAPTLAAGSVSLFEADGALCALGLKNVGGEASLRTFAVWSLESGAWVEKAICTGVAGNAYALGTGSLAYNFADSRFYKAAVCYYDGTDAQPAVLSFRYENGTFSDGTMTALSVKGASRYAQLGNCTVEDELPGDTLVAAVDNSCRGFYSFVDKRGTGIKYRVGPERARNIRFNSKTGDTKMSAWMLPGGSKPYSIKYDTVSKLYWAVTVPVTNRQESATVDAFTVAKRIGVYASPDLEEWWPCGILVDSEVAAFRAPSMEIVGDDLVIAYGVSADDGVGGAQAFDRPNYLASRRVANFRTSLVFEKPDGRYLLAANGGSVCRYWQTKGGLWLPGKSFASGAYGGVTLSMEVGIAAKDNDVYVGGENSKGRIFVFNRKGKYRKTLEMPDAASGKVDAVRFAANGKDLIVTDAFAKQAVYRVDPATGVWTELLSVASTQGTSGALVGRVRDALEASDGKLYVASSGGVNVFDAQGQFVKKIATGTYVGLALDEGNGRLFFSDQAGRIFKCDLSTGSSETILSNNMDANSALQLIWANGRLYAADARNYMGFEINPDAVNEEDDFLGGFESFARFSFIDENFTPGMMLLVK